MADTQQTPPAAPAAVSDFAAFEARENSLALGKDPEPTPEPTPESVPQPEPEPTPEPESTATASDPAHTPPKPDSHRTRRREQRDQDQINEVIRAAVREAIEPLQAELAKVKGGAAPTADAEPKADEFQPTRPKPDPKDFDDLFVYNEAVLDWKLEQRDAKAAFEKDKADRAAKETTEATEFHEKATTWIGRRDSFTAKHPEQADRLMAFLANVHAGTPLGDTILESEVGAELADYLAATPAEAERIARLSPIAQLRALGKLEAKFDPDAPHNDRASATTAGPAAGKTATSAPAPPRTLTARSATAADPAADALARGDFAAWEREENRKALAAHRS